jgi:L-asparaginase
MEILFIATGGSIDKDYPRATKGYAFEMGPPAVERILTRINPNFEFSVVPVLKKDSLDITADDREKIFNICINTQTNRIIITHGTDTMLDTAKELNKIEDKVIILTGAFRPELFKNSDAEFNLGCAIGAVSTLENGIYIVMHGRVYPYDKCTRDPQSGQFIEK